MEKIFQKVSQHAADIPIILVATKTDKYYGAQVQAAREELEDQIEDSNELMRICDSRAADEVIQKLNGIEELLSDVEGGRCDAAVAVRCSKKNSKSERSIPI